MSDRFTSTPLARRALVPIDRASTKLRQSEGGNDPAPAVLRGLRFLGFLTMVLYFWVILQAL